MSRKAKRDPTRILTVRIPQRMHDLMQEVADLRGQDLSAVVNHVLAEARTGLSAWLASHRAPAMSDERG
jgi:hypothetical protein